MVLFINDINIIAYNNLLSFFFLILMEKTFNQCWLRIFFCQCLATQIF